MFVKGVDLKPGMWLQYYGIFRKITKTMNDPGVPFGFRWAYLAELGQYIQIREDSLYTIRDEEG